jgi:hypothetical protein
METDRVESVQRGFREFWDGKQNDTGGLLFIGLKLSTTVYKRELLLIVVELISSGSGLKLLLVKVLSVAVQD